MKIIIEGEKDELLDFFEGKNFMKPSKNKRENKKDSSFEEILQTAEEKIKAAVTHRPKPPSGGSGVSNKIPDVYFYVS